MEAVYRTLLKRVLRASGMTLIEIIVVIIILSVLGSLAIPRFGLTLARQEVAEVATHLRAVHAAQQVYRFNTGVYWPSADCAGDCRAALNGALGLSIPSKTGWVLVCTAATSTTFSCIAMKDANFFLQVSNAALGGTNPLCGCADPGALPDWESLCP